MGKRVVLLPLFSRDVVDFVRRTFLWMPGAEVIKLFSCSTQLSMKFKMLINIEIAKIDGIFRFNALKPAI